MFLFYIQSAKKHVTYFLFVQSNLNHEILSLFQKLSEFFFWHKIVMIKVKTILKKYIIFLVIWFQNQPDERKIWKKKNNFFVKGKKLNINWSHMKLKKQVKNISKRRYSAIVSYHCYSWKINHYKIRFQNFISKVK